MEIKWPDVLEYIEKYHRAHVKWDLEPLYPPQADTARSFKVSPERMRQLYNLLVKKGHIKVGKRGKIIKILKRDE